VDFEGLLARAAEPTLQKLVGRTRVKLLASLDPSLTMPDHLRQIVLGLHSAQELLLEPESRGELLELLPPDEARALAGHLGLPLSEPYRELAEYKPRGVAGRSALLGYFGLTELDEVVEVPPPPVEAVSAAHGLFPHQRRAADQVWDKLMNEPRRVLLHMPTGAGKTRTAMNIVARFLREEGEALVIWLAHSEELCEQAAQEFRDAWSSLGDRDIDLFRWWGQHDPDLQSVSDGVVIAGLAKAYAASQRSTERFGSLAGKAGLVVIDEAHQAIAPTYQHVLQFFTTAGTQRPLLGLTATPGRSWSDIDEDERLADFFYNHKVGLEIPGFSSPVDYLVAEGYLASTEFVSLHHDGGQDISDRDLRELETELEIPPRLLAKLADDEQRNLMIVARLEQLMRMHRRVIVFAATVEHAVVLATVLRARDRDAAAVTGATGGSERARTIREFRSESEEPKALINFGVLTAGFDAPQTSAALIARPTKSLVLYSQMVGRATRGPRAGGNKQAEIVTVVDTRLPGFASMAEAFHNWEDVWK
jgi:superfamily II DNA or RNA helicase